MTVAIIGAGMAGAAAADELSRAGVKVTVFDKGRSAGGRMSSKRTAGGYLDLGAQYFTARNELFSQQVSKWLAAGDVSYWPANCYRFEKEQLIASTDQTARFVGSPSMQAPVKALLAAVPLQLNCRISRLHYQQQRNADFQSGWYLFDQNEQRFGPFQALLLTLPPVQLLALLATVSTADEEVVIELQQLAAQVQPEALLPCWAVNLQLTQPLPTSADAVFVKDGNVSWLARQQSKSGRLQGNDNWLVHFTPQCSAVHLNASAEQLVALAKAELSLIFDQAIAVTETQTHRWLYAQINPGVVPPAQAYSARLKLALAGDWLRGGRVENAWLSGVAAAKELIDNV